MKLLVFFNFNSFFASDKFQIFPSIPLILFLLILNSKISSLIIFRFPSNHLIQVYRPATLRAYIIAVNHPPSPFRVLGPLSNMKEFSKDFNCPEGNRPSIQFPKIIIYELKCHYRYTNESCTQMRSLVNKKIDEGCRLSEIAFYSTNWWFEIESFDGIWEINECEGIEAIFCLDGIFFNYWLIFYATWSFLTLVC